MLAVDLPAPAVQIAAKFNTVYAVLEGGALRCWGSNDNNQCGTGTYVAGDKTTAPVLPNFAPAARSVAVGRGQACVITLDDELWCWGSNGSSELGLGPDAPGLTVEPLRVSDIYVSLVAPGQDHTCAISVGGELYCWGDMLGADGHPGPMGHDDRLAHDVPARVGEDGDWLSISTDTFHSCGIRGDGELWCWGRNAEGQLGVGSQEVVPERIHVQPAWRFVDVAVGRFHTCALRDDGITLCTGANDHGELATGDSERRSSFTPLLQSALGP
jgi:alpha-tubulin suppressor-like RCC1 family protein